jgi:hypothetical protein
MAFGASTISGFAGAASDLFAASGHRSKAQGDLIEAQNYDLAAGLATQNEKFAETSTAIKEAQIDRENAKMIGGQAADVAGAGFAASGSALDLMRDSAAQGALTHAVAGEQGLIQEAGYTEQAQSYQNMSVAAHMAADAENTAATGSTITGILKGVAGMASLFTGLPISGAVDGFVPEAPSDPSNPLVINRYGQPGPASNNPANPATPLGAIY